MVDAAFAILPGKVDDWRDTGFGGLRTCRLIASQFPTPPPCCNWRKSRRITLAAHVSDPARADNLRLAELLQKLHGTRVKNFVTDDPKSDAEASVFKHRNGVDPDSGTNRSPPQFGKVRPTTPRWSMPGAGFSTGGHRRTSGAGAVARAVGKFRDPYLVTRQRGVEEIEVRGVENFVLQRVATNSWKLVDSEMPVDRVS